MSWDTSNGRTYGVVEEKLTAATSIKGHHVPATPDHPEYLVTSELTGEQAAHRRSALRKLRSRR